MEDIILWDIGNVLLKPIHGKILNEIFENKESNISLDDFKKETTKILNDSFTGRISLEKTWELMFEAAEIVDQKIIDKIRNVEVIRNENLLTYIKKELSQIYRIGIVSDLSQIGLYVIQKFYKDFLDICDSKLIFISTFSNETKRDSGEKYFHEIVGKIQNKNILFVDDEIKNIEAAKSTGIKTILYSGGYSEWDTSNKILVRELKKTKR